MSGLSFLDWFLYWDDAAVHKDAAVHTATSVQDLKRQ
jgi:hypothetical protein